MELETNDIALELSQLQVHLHEAVENGNVLERAHALEEELSAIIQKTRHYTEQLQSLMNFSAILNSSLDASRVREAAMSATCDLLHCDGATLYMVDEERGELFFETMVSNVAIEHLREIRVKIDEASVAGKAALHRKSAMLNESFRSAAAVPIIWKGNLLGVLQANNKSHGPFHEADLRLLETLAHQVGIAIENANLYENVKSQFEETAMALATAIEAKDRYTGGHTRRVALFAELIANHMGLDKEEVHEVKLSAILHDVGKIGIDDHVLKKEAPLSAVEWEHMKQHPELGWKILANVRCMKRITDGMRYHHERPDGLGYPKKLKGDQIPRIASIISVADTFDAMTSNRPYRKGLDYDTAFEEILRNRGTQFDEKVVDGFVRAFNMERMGKKRTKDRA